VMFGEDVKAGGLKTGSEIKLILSALKTNKEN
jgi:hypothetical protein